MATPAKNGWVKIVSLALSASVLLVGITVAWKDLSSGQEAIDVKLERFMSMLDKHADGDWNASDQAMHNQMSETLNEGFLSPTVAQVRATTRFGGTQ